MTPLRAGVVLLALCSVCLVVVILRAERVRIEARTEAHLSTLIESRRRVWNLQAELAQLRTPEAIRRRAIAANPAWCTGLEYAQTRDVGQFVAGADY
ncbi:MAG: hypothetical protein H6817_06785 [Phycisphaerales bacterium]|nr:hypothetical protein [Phycisphaerales bacterium]